MKAKKIVTFIISLLVPLAAGFGSSLLAGDIPGRYAELSKPFLSPPSGIFGIMWTALYILMGIGCYLVVVADAPVTRKTAALTIYSLQIVVNFFWSIVFFRFDMLWPAFIIILVLDVLVLLTITQFWKIRKVAGLLLVPYLLWILFASYLNLGFAVLN